MRTWFILLCGALSSCAIEKPAYESVKKDGSFEIRKYESIRVVSAPMDDMDERNQSFRKLFKYISGENADKKKIAMTSPVFMDEDTTPKGQMSFMIPSEIAKEGAPSPDAEEVTLDEIKSGTFAVFTFKGWNKPESREKASGQLDTLLKEHRLRPIGKKFFAFYDPPWTPEMFRQNEVWQRIKP
ncbi:MAG: heme-binding protein [Akkermansiaceae bacterium]